MEPGIEKGIQIHQTQPDVAPEYRRHRRHRTHRTQSSHSESQDTTPLYLMQDGFLPMYDVRRMSSRTHLVRLTSPATYPFHQTSHTTSPVGQMSYDVLLAFDRLPDIFPHLLNLQNLQLATRRPAHSWPSRNHWPDTSR